MYLLEVIVYVVNAWIGGDQQSYAGLLTVNSQKGSFLSRDGHEKVTVSLTLLRLSRRA
jgi:hypothetical protein